MILFKKKFCFLTVELSVVSEGRLSMDLELKVVKGLITSWKLDIDAAGSLITENVKKQFYLEAELAQTRLMFFNM